MFAALPLRHMVAFSLLFGCAPFEQQAHAQNFIGYTGKRWGSDYGVLQGECNVRQVLFTHKKESLPLDIARLELDEATHPLDSLCFGLTLELVPAGQFVRWVNPHTGAGFYFSAGSKSEACRTYLGVIAIHGQKTKFRGEACSTTPGVWRTPPPS